MLHRDQLLPWALKITAAAILLQTLYFKFSAHPEAVYIFTTLQMEPWGRIGIGVMELITSMLLLIPPRTVWLGAGLGLGLMAGAIFFHLTKLGLDVYNDGGRLIVMAIVVFIISAVLLWMNRRKIPIVGKLL